MDAGVRTSVCYFTLQGRDGGEPRGVLLTCCFDRVESLDESLDESTVPARRGRAFNKVIAGCPLEVEWTNILDWIRRLIEKRLMSLGREDLHPRR